MPDAITDDDINAFVPGPRVHIEGRPGGAACRTDLCRQGSVRCRRLPDRRRQSRLAEILPGPDPAFLGGRAAARCRRHADRQDHHRRGVARHRRRERVLRDAGQCQSARPGAGRLVLGLGGGGRGRDLRHRNRHRHRRLGAGAVELLRALRHPPDAWPDRCHRHAAAGAEFGHDRLVCARRRDLCPGVERDARRDDPGGIAKPADRGRRCVRFCRPGGGRRRCSRWSKH